LSPDAAPDSDYIHRTGAPPGFKRIHLVIGAVVFVVWFGVLGFVLTHGRDEESSVDVYSELPPGFSDALATQGVSYQGLSPVDATTESQVLAHVTTTANGNGGKPLVFRTSFSTTKGSGKPGTPTPALMVVVPDSTDSDGHVDFVDPATYRELDSVDYTGAGGSGGSATS
jgi:hypothetical protein